MKEDFCEELKSYDTIIDQSIEQARASSVASTSRSLKIYVVMQYIRGKPVCLKLLPSYNSSSPAALAACQSPIKFKRDVVHEPLFSGIFRRDISFFVFKSSCNASSIYLGVLLTADFLANKNLLRKLAQMMVKIIKLSRKQRWTGAFFDLKRLDPSDVLLWANGDKIRDSSKLEP